MHRFVHSFDGLEKLGAFGGKIKSRLWLQFLPVLQPTHVRVLNNSRTCVARFLYVRCQSLVRALPISRTCLARLCRALVPARNAADINEARHNLSLNRQSLSVAHINFLRTLKLYAFIGLALRAYSAGGNKKAPLAAR